MAKNPDIKIFAMIKRRTELLREHDHLLRSNVIDLPRRKRIDDEIAVIEYDVAAAEPATEAGYAAQVKAINEYLFEAEHLIQIAWRLGRGAARLGIVVPPALVSWQARAASYSQRAAAA